MPAVTDYGVDLELAIAVGRAEAVGRWGQGRWGEAVWGQTDTALGDWVDVSCFAANELGLAAGASDADGVVTRWEAASMSFTLLGDRFDPWSGPYAGLLGPMLPVRLRWRTPAPLADELEAPRAAGDWMLAFQGFIDAGGYRYEPHPDPRLCTAVVTAVDATTLLATFDGLEQSEQGFGESASERVHRILDLAAWPPVDRDVVDGGQPVNATTLAEQAWAMLLQVADTDLALLWVRRDGRLAYIPSGRVGEGSQLTAVLVVCPVDAVDGVQVVTMHRAQPDAVRNIVSISRQKNDEADTPATVTLRDESSIARYRARSYSRTDLIHTGDAWTSAIAQAVLVAGAWPSDAPRRVELDSALADPRVPVLLLGLEPNHTFDLTDGASTWRVGCVGWDVTVTRERISGTVILDDWSKWLGAQWGTAIWGVDRWGAG